MPKVARELTATEVRRLKPGLHAVGGVSGLLMNVKPTGARSWILRVMVGMKRRDIGLGGFPEITLAMAREKAREAKEQIRQGTDPVAERKAAKAALVAEQAKVEMTFEQAAIQCHAAKAPEFRSAKHKRDWLSSLEIHAFPVIGKLPVHAVALPHVQKVLEPIWQGRTETATRVRGRIEAVLAWATVSKYRTGDNPARWRGNLEAVLAKPGKLKHVEHHRAIEWKDAPEFMQKLRGREGMAARALEFLILTAARSGEVRGATWDEIDLDRKLWTVPAERMKAQREHVVPLSEAAIKLLKAVPRMQGSPFVFAAPRGGALSDMSLSAVMRRMKVEAVPHGFRSTFRDWVSETTSYPHEVAEKALAHTIPNAVERAYRRGDLLAKRIRLMEQWAAFLNAPVKTGDVVAIRA